MAHCVNSALVGETRVTEMAGRAGRDEEATGKGNEEMISVEAVCGSGDEGDAEKKSERWTEETVEER